MQIEDTYKCNVCGNIVQLQHVGGGELVCCNESMKLQEEKTQDEGQEKHAPVIEVTDNGVKVKVGDVPHPMDDAHYIEWIEVIVDGLRMVKYLKPGDRPEAEFTVSGVEVKARAYCNTHGLWKSE